MCLIAGSAGPCTLPSVSVAGAARRPASGWACPTLFWNAVVHGPRQSPGPAGPAEQPGLAGQSADRVPCWARRRRRWVPSRFRQVRGTDSTGTCEPDLPVAALGSHLPGCGAGRPEGGGNSWSCGELGALAGPSPLPHDSERPEQVPPGPCTDVFPRRGGQTACSLQSCRALHSTSDSNIVNALVLFACAALCESFSALLPACLGNTPAPPSVVFEV